MRNHTVVIGYGTKGRTAVAAMIGDGVAPADIVVVDTDQPSLDRANAAGLVTVRGDANKSDVLRLAGAQHANSIIVATNSDPTAVLVTLTARELAPNAKIIASVREAENQHLLRQSGADSVVVSSETAGPPARHRDQHTQRRRDDRGPADPGCRLRDRRARGRAQGGRRLAAASAPTSCSAWCATASCCGSTTPTSTPWKAPTGCSTSAAPGTDAGGLPSAQHPAAVARRCRPRRPPAHRHRRRDCRLGRRAAAAGGQPQPGADRRRPGGARLGRPAGRQAARRCGVPRPAGERPPRVGGARPAGGTRRRRRRGARPAPRRTGLRRRQRPAGGVRHGLLNWHDQARFSALDGAPTRPAKAGWSRVNPLNGHEELPRIDPAIICWCTTGTTVRCWPVRRCGRRGCSR